MKKIIALMYIIPFLALTFAYYELPRAELKKAPVGEYAIQVTLQKGIYPNKLGKVSIETDISKTICNPNWSTKSVRPSTSYTTPLKNKWAKEQGVNPKDYELDHIVSIELLGDPKSTDNLWLEPYNLIVGGVPAGARQKDAVENYLHKEICAGRISLDVAQKLIVNSWFQVYKDKIYARNTFGATEVGLDNDDI